VSGKLKEILVNVDEIAKIGEAIAILEIEGEAPAEETTSVQPETQEPAPDKEVVAELEKPLKEAVNSDASSSGKFYSPLVKSIAKEENISASELDSIDGSGLEGRVTKDDILKFVEDRKSGKA